MKMTVSNSNNRINIGKPICIKTLLKLAYIKLTGNLEFNKVIYGDGELIDPHSRSIYFPDEREFCDISSTDSICFRGCKYKIGYVLVVDMNENDF